MIDRLPRPNVGERRPTNSWPSGDRGNHVERRHFLYGLALAGVTSACAKGSDDTSGGNGADTTLPSAASVVAAVPAAATLPESVFSLGVASGDPTDDSVMLWTRLVPDPLAADGGAAALASASSRSSGGPVEVAFDVATDERFEDLVVSGIATATDALGHSVHVDVTGLDPDTWYFYRFRAGERTSTVGRTRTLPAPDEAADQFRFVIASCQDFQWGHYAAWTHAAAEDQLDAVVFLGDYIYEINLGDLSPTKDASRVWASDPPFDLAGYRQRYAQTKADAALAAAHAAVPWIVTWDDHEVANNYAGDVGQVDIDQPNSRERRLAAYQAWYEHMPVRITPDAPTGAAGDFDVLDIHRSFRFGDLVSLFVIETRQHADVPACRTDASLVSDDGPACDATIEDDRSNLGAEQEQWLIDALTASTSMWNVIANPIMFAGLNTGTAEEPAFTRDAWDGYPAARQRVIDAIVDNDVSNPVVVTGDWHASFVLDVPAEPGLPTDHSTATPVMPEFVVSSISSISFDTDYREQNPHLRYFDAEHGYAVVTVTPGELECTFRYITDVWDPASPIDHSDTWTVEAGSPTAAPA